MPVNTGNLIMGPGTLNKGAFGAVEPVDTAVATVPDPLVWTDVGGTSDGVEIAIDQDYTQLEVDQIVDIPERRLTKREATLKTNLAETTLDNLSLALNGATVAVGGTGATAFKSLTPVNGSSASQVTYSALLFDGFAPNGKPRRVIGRKMLSVKPVEFAYSKKNQTVFSVFFSAHYVSASIASFKAIDGAAA
jgi:hypothetical protein